MEEANTHLLHMVALYMEGLGKLPYVQ